MTTFTMTTTTSRDDEPTTSSTTFVVVDLPFVEYLKLEYAEAEQIVRHYSTVRLIVSTFLFGVAFNILKDKWMVDETFFFWLRMTGLIWLVSLVFLYTFTRLEQREVAYAKAIREAIQDKTIRITGGAADHSIAKDDVIFSRGDLRFGQVKSAFKDAPFRIALISTAIFIFLTAASLANQKPAPPQQASGNQKAAPISKPAPSWKAVFNPFGP